MTAEQGSLLGLLAAMLALFAWGRIRYDVVALGTLLAATFAGLVPADAAFAGFGNTAVITVAPVLTISAGLTRSGAVAVAASCAFLTPIGHQNNTLVMGAGRYRFGDNWRMGLPLEILIVAVSIPAILPVWPM